VEDNRVPALPALFLHGGRALSAQNQAISPVVVHQNVHQAEKIGESLVAT